MNVVAEMLLTQPTPMAIWATLMLLTFPALLLLGSPEAMARPRRSAQEFVAALRGRGEEIRRRATEAERAEQYAAEVRVAAARAETGAQRWQDRWEQSETELDAAYRAWLDADARLRTATAAAAWGSAWSVQTPSEYASRERYLHRKVAAAVHRGDLPAEALPDALSGRGGWDPRLHPADQDLVLARASAAWLRHRYDLAVTAERRAHHDVDMARRAGASLRHESRTATAHAASLRLTAGRGRALTPLTHRPRPAQAI
jgi:hypothetical protein